MCGAVVAKTIYEYNSATLEFIPKGVIPTWRLHFITLGVNANELRCSWTEKSNN